MKAISKLACCVGLVGALLGGCSTAHFKRDTNPTLHFFSVSKNVSAWSEVNVIWFVVSNPTDVEIERTLLCHNGPETYIQPYTEQFVVPPHSDKKISAPAMDSGYYACKIVGGE